MSAFGRFFRSRARPASEAEAMARIKSWTRMQLALPEVATITVSEIVCADPACPGTETVILVMAPGRKTRAFKLAKPADEVSEGELGAALSSSA